MQTRRHSVTVLVVVLSLLSLAGVGMRPRVVIAQDRSGDLAVIWAEDGKTFTYKRSGKVYRYDIAARTATEIVDATDRQNTTRQFGNYRITAARRPQPGHTNTLGPSRASQFTSSLSPNGRSEVIYRERNVWLKDSSATVAITTDGSEKARVKNGSAPWVYGEELDQGTAMWWSPLGDKIAFYRFDESAVADYYVLQDQTKVQDRLHVEAYPKAGAANPVVEVLVYDVATRRTVRIDVRNGQTLANDVVGYYVYNVGWTPDGRELTLYRTNRRQNVMEFAACNPETGKCRVVVHEEWPASWVINSPPMRYLSDGKRFIWTSERTGWRNLYLYDLRGTLLTTLTRHEFEVSDFLVDERDSLLYYMARDGDNPLKLQLHRVQLDGKGARRLTGPAFHHTVSVAPGGRHFVDVMETHDQPPVTWLRDVMGKPVVELARADSNAVARDKKLGRVELFPFQAADSVTRLYGMLHFPPGFDSTRQYPLLVRVYAGPGTDATSETYETPSVVTQHGFLVASLDARSAGGRGKRFLDAIYGRLGTVEVDDQAAGVKALWNRPYVDRRRVGIYGTSYGGYASIMALLRYPDLFQAASASSSVTDWRNYDTIYSERYMGLPQENQAGYDAGSVVRHAAQLQGGLLLSYGTADDNVHPSNSLQLMQALYGAGKRFDLRVLLDMGHMQVYLPWMIEFFQESLKSSAAAKTVP